MQCERTRVKLHTTTHTTLGRWESGRVRSSAYGSAARRDRGLLPEAVHLTSVAFMQRTNLRGILYAIIRCLTGGNAT